MVVIKVVVAGGGWGILPIVNPTEVTLKRDLDDWLMRRAAEHHKPWCADWNHPAHVPCAREV